MVHISSATRGKGRGVKKGDVDTCSVLLTWFIGSKLLWDGSNDFCCSDLFREHVKTLRMNVVSPEAVTLFFLFPSSLLH